MAYRSTRVFRSQYELLLAIALLERAESRLAVSGGLRRRRTEREIDRLTGTIELHRGELSRPEWWRLPGTVEPVDLLERLRPYAPEPAQNGGPVARAHVVDRLLPYTHRPVAPAAPVEAPAAAPADIAPDQRPAPVEEPAQEAVPVAASEADTASRPQVGPGVSSRPRLATVATAGSIVAVLVSGAEIAAYGISDRPSLIAAEACALILAPAAVALTARTD